MYYSGEYLLIALKNACDKYVKPTGRNLQVFITTHFLSRFHLDIITHSLTHFSLPTRPHVDAGLCV